MNVDADVFTPGSATAAATATAVSGTEAMNALYKTGDLEQDGEDLTFNPYNPNNVEITETDVHGILSQFGLPPRIHNFELYRRAFIHRSYTKRPELENELLNVKLADKPDDCLKLSTKSNERLEFLGDGVLELVVKYYLYRRFPKEDEGFMTEKKIALVKNEHIGKLSLALGLQKWFVISRHAEEHNTRTNLKKLGCLFESFIGAIYLDNNKYGVAEGNNVFSPLVDEEDMYVANSFITGHGFNYAQKFIEAVLEREVDWTRLIAYDDNFKNQLQVKVQKAFKVTPHYIQMDADEATGEVTMAVCLCLNQQIYETSIEQAIPFDTIGSFDKILEMTNDGTPILVLLGSASHKIKKKAEQHACAEALKCVQ